jgi:protein FRA10AC1
LWDENSSSLTWEQKLAKKYYEKLFREYCICDLSRYKENKVSVKEQERKQKRKKNISVGCRNNCYTQTLKS